MGSKLLCEEDDTLVEVKLVTSLEDTLLDDSVVVDEKLVMALLEDGLPNNQIMC